MNADVLFQLLELFVDVASAVRGRGGDASDPAEVLSEMKGNPIYRARLDAINRARDELAELRARSAAAQAEDGE